MFCEAKLCRILCQISKMGTRILAQSPRRLYIPHSAGIPNPNCETPSHECHFDDGRTFLLHASVDQCLSRSIVLTCIKSLLSFNHCICTFNFLFLTFVSCLLTVTLHIVDVRLTGLINITYLLTYLLIKGIKITDQQ